MLFTNTLFAAPAFADSEVVFECDNLKTALQEILGTDEITQNDMLELTGKVDLSYKNITSIRGLEYAENVEYLILTGNSITDISPILNLSSLNTLYLDYNWIKEIPDAVTGLSALEHLDISNNEIENIPPQFFQLPSLRRLYIDGLELVSPPDFSYVKTNLERFDISGANFENYDFISSFTNLELLAMNGCNLEMLPDLSAMQRLSYLYFADNKIVSLPEYLSNLPLIRLDISGNFVSNLPQSFESLKSLEQLVMTDNYFVRLPDVVTQMESLEVLMCGQNIISDVPDALYSLKNVKRASFASNNLTTLQKFTEFEIPYSYQISFDYNYLDLSDGLNIDVLDDYHNDGGVQKAAQLAAQVTAADTQKLTVQCSFDMAELELISQNAEIDSLILFINQNGALIPVGETLFDDEQEVSLTVTYENPQVGVYDYVVCLNIHDGMWPGKYLKYSALLSDVETVQAATAQPDAATAAPTQTPTTENTQEPAQKQKDNTKILLYILLLGVIIIISAIIIHLLFYRRK